LWEQLGSPSEFVHIPYGQSRYHLYRGEIELTQRLDQDLLNVSQQRNDPAGLVLGHTSSGRTLMLAGKFALSRSHLEAAIARHKPNFELVHQAGTHPHVVARALLVINLFCLGYLEQALVHSNAAITEARRLAHPPSVAVSLGFSTRLLWLLGEIAALDEHAIQLVATSTEQGFAFWGALGMIYRGWVMINNGDAAEGMSLLRRGSSAYRSTGAEAWMPYYTALLASAYQLAGQVAEALVLLRCSA
jgi:predicted ATPase